MAARRRKRKAVALPRGKRRIPTEAVVGTPHKPSAPADAMIPGGSLAGGAAATPSSGEVLGGAPAEMVAPAVQSDDRTLARFFLMLLSALRSLVPSRRHRAVRDALSRFTSIQTDQEPYRDCYSDEVDKLTARDLEGALALAEDETTRQPLLDVIRWNQDRDDDRTRTLDSKAATLAGLAGTSLTILFTLGGLLLKDGRSLGPFFVLVVAAYLCTLVCLFFCIRMATRSLQVRQGWAGTHPRDLFLPRGETANQKAAWWSAHIWKVYQRNILLNDDKAEDLAIAQGWFTRGMSILVLAGLVLGAYFIWKA